MLKISIKDVCKKTTMVLFQYSTQFVLSEIIVTSVHWISKKKEMILCITVGTSTVTFRLNLHRCVTLIRNPKENALHKTTTILRYYMFYCIELMKESSEST